MRAVIRSIFLSVLYKISIFPGKITLILYELEILINTLMRSVPSLWRRYWHILWIIWIEAGYPHTTLSFRSS
ncbi:unnamed protein product [Heterotrigona itama]|uniref:Uncharacterized protein n=1 Tax=Heterotrigona itama TaxID=395501 RepID=A0A6V7H974_9HYME|nr:unnamed protein product [Heterotrigona itama]